MELSAAAVLEVVASYAAGLVLAVVGFEHRHRFGVGQAGMRLSEAAECLFVEVGQPAVECVVFGIRTGAER